MAAERSQAAAGSARRGLKIDRAFHANRMQRRRGPRLRLAGGRLERADDCDVHRARRNFLDGHSMKYFSLFSAIFGVALLTGLTAYYGFTPVIQAVASAGWGVVLVVLARGVAIAGSGIAWWFLLTPEAAGQRWHVVGVRYIRESINTMFPFALGGGDMLGARLLILYGIPTRQAIASVFIDIFVTFVSLLIFVSAGVGILATLAESHQIIATTSLMLAISLPALAGFFLALNFGAFGPVMKWLVAFGEKRQWAVFDHVVGLGNSLQQIWRNRRGLSGSFLVHLAVFLFGSTEVWITLLFMGHPVSPIAAIAIESIGQGGRGAAFALPGGLGVQDGTLIAVCALFGVPAEVALALALIKRIPEIGFGFPALWAWHILERRRQLAVAK